nr:hypothetical protein [Butyrivibrio sp.]
EKTYLPFNTRMNLTFEKDSELLDCDIKADEKKMYDLLDKAVKGQTAKIIIYNKPAKLRLEYNYEI